MKWEEVVHVKVVKSGKVLEMGVEFSIFSRTGEKFDVERIKT